LLFYSQLSYFLLLLKAEWYSNFPFKMNKSDLLWEKIEKENFIP
jgi:hypothetical protein